MPPDSPPLEPRDSQRPGRRSLRPGPGWPRWATWAALGLVLLLFLVAPLFSPSKGNKITYSQFLDRVRVGRVESVDIDNNSGSISGTDKSGDKFTVHGPSLLPPDDLKVLRDHNVKYDFKNPQPNALLNLIPYLLPFVLIIGFFVWMNRRAQGQMGGIMQIGRSRAKTYSTEKPGTTFADVAGYEGVKQEIKEVVDFLKTPQRFAAIGARIPKGVLLVGPPGTGKTLIARAVAGEAGVPFLSVTGSDFMEMFVGVGASRVRDLFQQARKMGRAIIFVDEIDSIGRKRGAGLGGGHDEREQTLNQMLSEMDGFEATEGIVMMAATNRPDILDSALLRPGRFDRQVVVPLPEFEERCAILEVHAKDKKIAPDVDLRTVAKGTPGMSGADLANLVNEAALFAVRRGDDQIHMIDFESARDRVLMGMRRESMALSDEEKEAVAYHEGGHAVCAAVLPNADPLHKVTILPTGMALGVTQQLPEERHLYRQDYIEDSLVVRM
ncbi:MAG: cell division protease FtsH, partial [Acidimicrobiaceae bacterium]|nr:cell division protease FtsH [Acidimicrobiaceae bacterium]